MNGRCSRHGEWVHPATEACIDMPHPPACPGQDAVPAPVWGAPLPCGGYVLKGVAAGMALPSSRVCRAAVKP